MICDHGLNLDDCAICHKLPGECDHGSCEEKATHRLTHSTGRDVRIFCTHHATASYWQCVRAGYSIDAYAAPSADDGGQDEFESQLPGADEWDGTPPDVSYDR